ncbi:MAG: CHAT domain-containing protein [Tepidisphaeraceae bacterium]|jgi:CHAT domain-containing protein
MADGIWRKSVVLALNVILFGAPAVRADAGQDAYDSGHFLQAAAAWEQAAKHDEASAAPIKAAQVWARRAQAEENLGDYPEAIESLRRGVLLGGADGASYQVALAQAYILARSDSMGMSYLPDAQKILDSLAGNPSLSAAVHNAYGSLYLAKGQPKQAAESYQLSLAAARQQGNAAMIAQAAANAAVAFLAEARSQAHAGEIENTVASGRAVNTQAWEAANELPGGHATAFLLLTIGQSDEGLAELGQAAPELRLRAYAAYQLAMQRADATDDIVRSYALGYTGHLYELDGRNDEAQRLTAQALFLAQRLQMPNLLYLWQWQSGRLLKAAGDREGAIAAYQTAVASLRAIQSDLSAGGGNSPGGVSYREVAGNVYDELADILLKRAATEPEGKSRQRDLSDARDTLENLKTAELQNYFQDRCERLLEQRRTSIETIDPHTAVVYYVPLADRLEILVASGSPLLQRFTVPVTADALTQVARRFREEVSEQSSEEYFIDGQQLYQWLIAPIEPYLRERGQQSTNQAVDTLVFVPDGALRSVPMAALADEQGRFLIQQYAVAISPGLRLTQARDSSQTSAAGEGGGARVLISGLSVAQQGFPALKYVPEEMRQINTTYAGKTQTLVNEQFSTSQVDRQFAATDFSIVHIASHGHFGSSAADTYVLDFDGRLDLDDLERLIEPSKYRQRPVDLLTLSACETAAGDDRAALGLAGIAVKAGALSAMATLWSVNDRSASILIPRFYAHLAEANSTKAKALQTAQLELLTDPSLKAYRHPYFWSPYLIVGNWL